MPNVVLDRLLAERSELIATMESVLGQVEGRDLTDAEQAVLDHTRARIQEVDKQIEPLENYERVKAQHKETLAELPAPRAQAIERVPAQPRRIDGVADVPLYRSPGAFVVDYLRGAGIMERGAPDHDAMARVQQVRVVANQ